MNKYTQYNGLLLSVLVLSLSLPEIVMATMGELILFSKVHLEYRHNLPEAVDLEKLETEPGLNIFYTKDFAQLRFLGEVFLSPQEQEVERLQLGWLMTPTSILWLGRFHTPLGYWNTRFHHGNFLQTTIHRPAIADYEDDGGVLPMHMLGLLLEGSHLIRSQSIDYAVSIGRGPRFDVIPEPVNIVEPMAKDHDLMATFRVNYKPDELKSHEFGAFLNYAQMPSVDTDFDRIDQTVIGGFASSQWHDIQLFGTVFYIKNRLNIPSSRNIQGQFSHAYLQVEYPWQTDTTVYSRIEKTINGKNDPYLAFFPSFVNRNAMVGLRYELSRQHAVAIDVAHMDNLLSKHWHISGQWSAVFP